MKVNCRSCDKKFASNSDKKKHEWSTGQRPKDTTKKILFDSKNGIYLCTTENCKTYVNTKCCIKRHLKNCNEITKNRKKHERNEICKYWQKKFQKNFSRNRHVKQCHSAEISDGGIMDFINIDLIVVEVQPDEEVPTMVQIIHPESPEEKPPKVAQGTSPLPPDEQHSRAVQRTSPMPPDEQPPTVVQRISPVWPASHMRHHTNNSLQYHSKLPQCLWNQAIWKKS